MRRTTWLILVLPLVATSSASAQQTHACIKPDGALVVTAAAGGCGDDETPISWSAQRVPGAVGANAPEGLFGAGAEAPRLLDATGAGIGRFMEVEIPAEEPLDDESDEIMLSSPPSR